MTPAHEGDYSSKAGRIARVITYLLWCGAGGILSSNPSPLVRSGLYGLAVYSFAVFIFLGALASTIGAISDRWIGEYVGLPLVISTMWVYGGLALAAQPIVWPRVAVGLFFLSFGFKIIPRLLYIRKLVDEEKERAKSKVEDE